QLHPAVPLLVGLCRLHGAGRALHPRVRVDHRPQPRRCGAGATGRARMTDLEIALASFPLLLVLILLRMPIGLAMLVLGLAGNVLVNNSTVQILSQLKSLTYDTFSSYSLSIIPLFLLMGQFATH